MVLKKEKKKKYDEKLLSNGNVDEVVLSSQKISFTKVIQGGSHSMIKHEDQTISCAKIKVFHSSVQRLCGSRKCFNRYWSGKPSSWITLRAKLCTLGLSWVPCKV